MRARVHLAPPVADDCATPDGNSPELIAPPAPGDDLGLTPYSGFITYHFAEAAVVHRGVFNAIEQRLRSRFPTIGIEGSDVHVSFALEEDSPDSRARVETVARKLHELLPNSSLGEVTIGFVPYNRPRRGGHTLTAVPDPDSLQD